MSLLPLLLALSAASPADAEVALRGAGYAEVRELEYEDGLWEAEVRRNNGYWSEIAVDPRSGEIFDPLSARPLLSLADVLAALEAAGYRDLHDVDRDGALWEVDAVDASGRRVELRLSGYDARVLHVRNDGRD